MVMISFSDWVRLTFNNSVNVQSVTLQDLQGNPIAFTTQGGGNQLEIRNINTGSGVFVLMVITNQGVVIEYIMK